MKKTIHGIKFLYKVACLCIFSFIFLQSCSSHPQKKDSSLRIPSLSQEQIVESQNVEQLISYIPESQIQYSQNVNWNPISNNEVQNLIPILLKNPTIWPYLAFKKNSDRTSLCWAGGEKGASLPLHSSELDKLLAEMNLEPTWATKIKDLHQQMIFEMSAEMWSKNKNSWFSFYSDYPLSAWVEFVLNSFSFLPSHLGLGDKKSSLELKTRFIETILSFEKSPENIQIWHGVLVPYLLEEHQDESLRQLVLDISKKQKTIKTYFGAELGTSQIIRYLDNKKIIDDKVKRIQTIQDYQSLFHKKIDRSTSSDPSLYYQEDEYYTLIPIFPSGAIRMAGEPSPSYMWDPVLDYLNRERSLLFLKGLELLSKKSEPAMIKKVFDPMMDFRLGEMPHKKELDYQTLKKIALFINKDESSSPYLVNDKEQLVKLSDGNYLLEYLVLENQWVIVENYRSGHETGFIIIDISKADYKILHKFIMLYASRD